MTQATLALGWLLLAAGASPPAPPRLPDGIADATGRVAFLRAREAGIVAVHLRTGKVRWSMLSAPVP